MLLLEQIYEILRRNHRPEVLKNDSKVKASAVRVIYDLINNNLIPVHNNKVFNKEITEIHNLSNFELLNILESAIIALTFTAIDKHIAHSIESIEETRKNWYTPKEIALALETITLKKHNQEKIRKLLDSIAKEGKIMKMTDKTFEKKYRVIYTK